MSDHTSEEEINDDEPAAKPVCLNYFQSSLFASVLEDTIAEFRILAECNNELRIHKVQLEMTMLLACKYGVEQPKVKDELQGIDPQNLGLIEYKLSKLHADRKLAIDTIISTYKDLTLNNTYDALTKHVNSVCELDQYRARLEEDEIKNRGIRRDFIKQIRQQRNHVKTVIYDSDSTIDDLKTQVEDAVLYSECRYRYTDNWQRARTEQHLQTIKNNESGPSESIEYYKQRSDHEQRVHAEVDLLTNIAINETLKKVEDWMTKFDQDMENFDLRIQIKKNEYHDMYEKRVGLEDTIEKHDVLMKAWVHFKDEREKLRLYRETMNKSAIVVQAWWRGLLVRRQLGPYKPAKKKKGPPKK